MTKDKVKIEKGTGLTDCDIKSLARTFLPHIREFYESDEGRAEFEAWKSAQERAKAEDS